MEKNKKLMQTYNKYSLYDKLLSREKYLHWQSGHTDTDKFTLQTDLIIFFSYLFYHFIIFWCFTSHSHETAVVNIHPAHKSGNF